MTLDNSSYVHVHEIGCADHDDEEDHGDEDDDEEDHGDEDDDEEDHGDEDDDHRQLRYNLEECTSEVGGVHESLVSQGQTTFTGIIFLSSPGSTHVEFELASDNFDTDAAKRQYGDDFELEHMIVNFRYCQPGEISDIGDKGFEVCRECSANSYSFTWNATE